MRLSHLLQAATLAAFFPSSGSCIPTWDPWQAPCPSLPADILASFKMTNSTRTFIEGLFSALALDNFGASFASALSDDLTWTVTGSSPIAGTYHPKTAYISQVNFPSLSNRDNSRSWCSQDRTAKHSFFYLASKL